MLRKLLPLVLVLLLTGCAPRKQVYETVFLDAFDTVISIRGYETSQKAFQETAEKAHREILRCHQLFDVYNTYPGISNLATVNAAAGGEPVAVEEPILDLLDFCRNAYDLTDGRVNAAMGSVLQLWHEAREAGLNDPEHSYLPDGDALREAAKHCSFDTVILGEGTVFLSDPDQRLDVGAIAKGWTAQRVAEQLPEGYLLNMGGNICATGPKPDGSLWVIGIQNPDGGDYLRTVGLTKGSTVTSGDYQRQYIVDGKVYHHIIDPDTLMPAAYWRSVTILHPDSGLADCLSTALFLLPLEEGRALAEKTGAQVLWVAMDGTQLRTEGFDMVKGEW